MDASSAAVMSVRHLLIQMQERIDQELKTAPSQDDQHPKESTTEVVQEAKHDNLQTTKSTNDHSTDHLPANSRSTIAQVTPLRLWQQSEKDTPLRLMHPSRELKVKVRGCGMSRGSFDGLLSDLSLYLSQKKTAKERWQLAFKKIKRARALGGSKWKASPSMNVAWKEAATRTTVRSNLEIFLYGSGGQRKSP